jgi:hypothetical protein
VRPAALPAIGGTELCSRSHSVNNGSLRAMTAWSSSYCRTRGAVVVMAKMGGIKFLRGEGALTSYRFHTGTAQHFFCSRCGIYTHHQRRSNPHLYAVNVACLDGVSPFDFSEVPVTDGVNHTKDTGKPTRRAGTLRFIAAD